MMILKVTKKQTFSFNSVFFQNIFLGLRWGFLFNETICKLFDDDWRGGWVPLS